MSDCFYIEVGKGSRSLRCYIDPTEWNSLDDYMKVVRVSNIIQRFDYEIKMLEIRNE